MVDYFDDGDVDDLSAETREEIAYAVGLYTAKSEAIRAYEAGEIDQWIEYVTPKSIEEWDEWHESHEEGYENRWKV